MTSCRGVCADGLVSRARSAVPLLRGFGSDDCRMNGGPCPLSRCLSGLCTCTNISCYPGYVPAVAVPLPCHCPHCGALCIVSWWFTRLQQRASGGPDAGVAMLDSFQLTRMRCRDMLQVFSDGSFAPMQTSCRLTPSRPPPQHRALGGYRQAGLSRVSLSPLCAPTRLTLQLALGSHSSLGWVLASSARSQIAAVRAMRRMWARRLRVAFSLGAPFVDQCDCLVVSVI